MKTVFKKFGQVLIFYFASMLISLFASIVLNIPLKFLITNYNNLTNFIVGVLSLCIALFSIFFYEGYKTKKFVLKSLLISLGLLLCFVVIISTLIGHAVYISGPTVYLADYIIRVKAPAHALDLLVLYRYSLIFMLLAFIFIYAPIMLIANYLGVKFKNRKFTYTKK